MAGRTYPQNLKRGIIIIMVSVDLALTPTAYSAL